MSSLDLVKQLRERTGAGMMDCKAALASCGGDLEKAVDALRKKGLASAAKRAGREAKEGLILARASGAQAAIAEVNCETDFVGRTDDFRQFGTMVLDEAFSTGEKAVEADKVAKRLAELSGKIGEKIVARRAKKIQASGGTHFVYIHSNNKLAVVLELFTDKTAMASDASFTELGKNLAMQVAAANPLCVDRSEVPADVLEREKAIYREEIKGKPDNIVEKILQGKLEKFYQTNCLTEQPYIKDDKQSVKQLVEATAKKMGCQIQIKEFVRWQLGENLPN